MTVWDEKRLAKQGIGGILGVGQGSPTPPRLIRLDYTPAEAGRRTPHVVLVGKGITFDTGGISIKPGEAMVNMKRDMTGGGVVIAAMAALAAVGCRSRSWVTPPGAWPARRAHRSHARQHRQQLVAQGQETGRLQPDSPARPAPHRVGVLRRAGAAPPAPRRPGRRQEGAAAAQRAASIGGAARSRDSRRPGAPRAARAFSGSN